MNSCWSFFFCFVFFSPLSSAVLALAFYQIKERKWKKRIFFKSQSCFHPSKLGNFNGMHFKSWNVKVKVTSPERWQCLPSLGQSGQGDCSHSKRQYHFTGQKMETKISQVRSTIHHSSSKAEVRKDQQESQSTAASEELLAHFTN